MKKQNIKIPSVLGLLGDVSWYGIGPISSRAIQLFLVPIYTIYLSPSEFGVIALVSLIVGIPKLASDWGVTWSIQRDYIDYNGTAAKEYLFTVLCINLISSVVAYGSVFFLFNKIVPLITSEWSEKYNLFLKMSLINAIFSDIITVTETYLIIDRRPKVYSIFRITLAILAGVLQLYLFIVINLGLLSFFLTELLAGVLGCIVGIWILFPQLKPHFRLDAAKRVAEFGWQVIPSQFIQYIFKRGDQWIVQALLSLNDLGLYSFGMKFYGLLSLFTVAIKTAWRPVYFRQIKENESKKKIEHYGNVMFSMALLILLFCMLFAKEITFFLTDPAYHNAYIIAVILLPQAFLFVPDSVPGNSLLYEKKVYLTFLPSLIIGIGSLLIAYFLAPNFGTTGVALSRLISSIVTSLSYIYVAYRYTKVGVPIDWVRWVTLTIMLISILIVIFIIDDISFWILCFAKVSLLFFASLLIAWQERVVIASRLSRIIKYN